MAYERTVRFLYEIDEKIDVFTGLNLYEQFLIERSGKRVLRDRFAAFEAFLGRHFFKGQSIDIVPEYTRDKDAQHIRVKIGTNVDHQLHHLGDGINALILLVYRIFMADAGTWFFIEEPETHLHPGLQRIFIETLLNDPEIRDKEMRFFLTTHSNHLLEVAMNRPDEVAVFSLASGGGEGKFLVSNRQGPDLQILDELGVHNASVLLANCSIWIEGPSDRYYISAYLTAYARAHPAALKLREDIEYAFFEYAGSNLQHYLFAQDPVTGNDEVQRIRAQFIANRVFLLADQDLGKDRKHRELEAAANPPQFVYATTHPGIEIENLLTPAILRLVFPQLFKGPKVIKLLKPAELEFFEEKLPFTRLGTYLDRVLRPQLDGATPKLYEPAKKTDDESPEPETIEASTPIVGRTLIDRWKDRLAREVYALAIEEKLDWSMLSPTAQRLTQSIVDFIQSNTR